MRKAMMFFWICAATVFLTLPANADWVTKSGEFDYACHLVIGPNGVPDTVRLDGMPDFDQKQDNWMNGQGQWTWCGPVAVANCLWWFDSKFERIWMWGHGQQYPVMPPAISDHYALVHAIPNPGANWDDHAPANVIPYVNSLAAALPGGAVPPGGVNGQQLKTMIENYLASAAVNLYGHFNVTIVSNPTFDYIYEQVEISQDVVMLLGFWQMNDAGEWVRFGGHWVTVAGVDSQEVTQTISWSDPVIDNAENGRPGVVWNGFLIPHQPIPGHAAGVHNDAGNVSHDHYASQPSYSPGGGIGPLGYDFEYFSEGWWNFQGLNFPSRLEQYRGNYDPNRPVHTEIEDLVVICPNFDYGDLGMDYPTIDIESCGPAHPLSDKAWLGESIDAEIQPRIYDQETTDDGVTFVSLPWTPCMMAQVNVMVTTGAHYAGEPLYLNAWKDGNIDGDFDDGPLGAPEDDFLCCDEWVIQDVPVAAGLAPHVFCDPGITNIGIYDLRMRFRLTSQPVGRFGYGGYWLGGVSNGLGTYDIDWVLGEVEDYDSTDAQLAVELRSFEAIPLDRAVELVWVTGSERENDLFSLSRRTNAESWSEIARVPSHGNSTSDQQYSFRDTGLENGRLYEYRLTATDIFGSTEILATESAMPSAILTPTEYALAQNFPNPFNASTEIQYAIPAAGHVTLNVFNTIGQLVATLVDREQTANSYRVTFDAAQLTSGVYVYVIEVNEFRSAHKMALIR